ncbi:MAG: hypothetical protein WEA99_08045 [Brumimicrobium sp.]
MTYKMEDNNYHEQRVLYSSNENSDIFIDEEGKYLKKYLNEFDKLIILGSPGIGKTEELKKLFQDLWDVRMDTGVLPIAINLQRFRLVDRFEDLISYANWEKHQRIVFILDGLDEIANIQDFISSLSSFIKKHRNDNYKYVLSCRYNIFLSNKISLSEFKKLFLSDLDLVQAQNILKNKYGIVIPYENLFGLDNVLKNPFVLEQFASYYKKNKKIPENLSTLLDQITGIMIKKHLKKVQKRNRIPEPKFIKHISKCALANELTQKSSMLPEDIDSIIGDQYQDFIENPFFKMTSDDEFMFIHRQFQEYFVSRYFSKLNLEELLEIISIENKNRIKPSLFNSLSFLLNVKESNQELEDLLTWVSEHEPDLLFKADSDRIENFRIPFFQKYFKKECVETTLWIGNTTSVSVEEIARFADCPENLKFLMTYFLDEKKHFRVRISALNLLEHFEPKRTLKLKTQLTDILKKPDTKINLKANIIELIQKWQFVDEYPYIIHEVIKIFEKEDHSEIGSRILSLIGTDKDKIDEYYDFITKEFDFTFGKQKRLNDDEVRRGNDWKVEDLMLQLNDSNKFLKLLTEYFKKNHFKHHYPEYKEEKIIIRLKELKKGDPDIIFKLAKPIVTDNHFNPNYKDDFIVRIINEFSENFRLFKWLFKTQDFSKCKWLMARIANKKCIDYYIDNWIKVIDKDSVHLEGFRNIVSSYHHHHNNWHKRIEDSYKEAEVELKQPLSDSTPIDELNKKYKTKVEEDLKLLFNRDELLTEVERLFESLKTKKIVRKDLYDDFSIKENRDDDFLRHFGYRGIGYEILNSLLVYDKKEVTLNDCKEYIDDPKSFIFFIKGEVKQALTHDRIEVDTSLFKSDLTKVVKDLIKQIRVTDILEYKGRSKFSIKNEDLENYKSFHIIQAIHELLLVEGIDIQLPDEFLINTLEYFEIKSFDENQSKFDKYLSKINDKVTLRSKIIENLSRPIFSSVYMKHAFYALENNLKESFDDIKRYLLTSDEIRSELSLLNKYIDINGSEILLEMMTDIDSVKCWKAIEISMKIKVHEKECVSLAKKYIATKTNKFEKDAARVLFKTNQPEIISYISEDIEGRIHIIRAIHTSYTKNYKIIPNNDFDFIERLFYVVYNDYEGDQFEKAALNDFFRNYVINIASQKENYEKLSLKLNEIKENPTILDPDKDHSRFFINLIIDECEKAYINEMSKPMSFKEALKLVKEIEI